jgi:hypothetical protein
MKSVVRWLVVFAGATGGFPDGSVAGDEPQNQGAAPTSGTATVNFSKLAEEQRRSDAAPPPLGLGAKRFKAVHSPLKTPVVESEEGDLAPALPLNPASPGAVPRRPGANSPLAARALSAALPSGEVEARPLRGPEMETNFPAIISVDPTTPPDTQGAAGPGHLLVALNSQMVIQDRSGIRILSPLHTDGFWSKIYAPELHVVYDPRVLYDRFDRKWIVVAAAYQQSDKAALLVAVSKGIDPVDDWEMISFPIDLPDRLGWLDYPCVGLHGDRLVIYGMIYHNVTNAAIRSQLYVIDKKVLYGGDIQQLRTRGVRAFRLKNPLQNLVPAVCFDEGPAPLYLIQSSKNSSKQGILRLWEVDLGSDPPLRRVKLPQAKLSPWAFEPLDRKDFAPQLSSDRKTASVHLIQMADARVQNAVLRDGNLWFAHTVFLPADKPTQGVIQWWQLSPGDEEAKRIRRAGRIGDPGGKAHYGYPSIAVNAKSDALIGFTRFSADQFASAGYALLPHGEDVFRADRIYHEGQDEYYNDPGTGENRWGDYSTTMVDPDGELFWTIQKYAEKRRDTTQNGGRWGTWWAHVHPSRWVLERPDRLVAGVISESREGSQPPGRAQGQVAKRVDLPSVSLPPAKGGRPVDIEPIGNLKPFKVPGATPESVQKAPKLALAPMTPVTKGPPVSFRLVENRPITGEPFLRDTHPYICEPNVATTRQGESLLVANFFAAYSNDLNKTFGFLDAGTAFPDFKGSKIFCDQMVHYHPGKDLMVWVIEYVAQGPSPGGIRLAFASGPEIAKRTYAFLDFPADSFPFPYPMKADFPDMNFSNNYIYINFNLYTRDNEQILHFHGSVVMRIPLDQLATHDRPIAPQFYVMEDVGNLRGVQGCGGVMRWVAHTSQATVRVLDWPEDQPPIRREVIVGPWRGQRGEYTALGPDGRNWLGRCDERITTAWQAGEAIGFAWTAAQDEKFRQPHVRVVLLDEETYGVIAEPDIWRPNYAYAYAAACPNANGEVAVSLFYGGGAMFGGGARYPSHAVGRLLVGKEDQVRRWELVTTAEGKVGPGADEWGDFLTVRPHGPAPKEWVTAGYALEKEKVEGPDLSYPQIRFIRIAPSSE